MTEKMMVMGHGTERTAVQQRSALSQFRYENGYEFRGTDLGNEGVKIELVHNDEPEAAIILPPAKAEQCARWILQTIGQHNHRLPPGTQVRH